MKRHTYEIAEREVFSRAARIIATVCPPHENKWQAEAEAGRTYEVFRKGVDEKTPCSVYEPHAVEMVLVHVGEDGRRVIIERSHPYRR